MFHGTKKFNQPVTWLRTTNAVSTQNMFALAQAFNQGKDYVIGVLRTQSLQLLPYTVLSCFGPDVSHFEMGKVTDAAGMFMSTLVFNQDVSM
jgi:Mycoplasma protein of unknown function, DUF285